MKIVAFAASNSQHSINKALINYCTTLLSEHEIKVLDINDYAMPIYSIDIEETDGIPEAASNFLGEIASADALLISFAEHNGNYTAAYKNLFDWASRQNRHIYQDKPIIMLSTSPGAAGANTVLQMAVESAHFFSGNVLASLSIPSFHDNFNDTFTAPNNPKVVEQLENTLSSLTEVAA